MAKVALTDAAVKRLKPPAKGQVEYFDVGYSGFALRISYGGSKSWRLYYRHRGEATLRILTLGQYPAMTLAQAREAWRDAREEINAGRELKQKVAPKTSTLFDAVFEDWLAKDQAKNRTRAEVERGIRRDVLPYLTGREMTGIVKRDCLDILDRIAGRGAVIQARRVHSHLKRLFTWAVERDIITGGDNPMATVKRLGQENERERVLTDKELAKVWDATGKLSDIYRDQIRMLILTGQRYSEIGELDWSEIGEEALEDGRAIAVIGLSASRTKNKKAHMVPLSAPARAILGDNRPSSGRVFSRGGKATRSRSGLKDEIDSHLDIEHWTFHDLRRTVATGLQKLKVPLPVTEAVLNHTAGSKSGIVKVYQRHDYLPEKAAALESWGARVMFLVEGGKTGEVVPMTRTA